MEDTNTQAKQCSHCREVLPLSEFHKHPTAKYGVKHTCRECTAKANYEQHSRRLARAGKKRRVDNPTYTLECRAKRGDVRGDGMVFWSKRKIGDVFREWWVTPEKFEQMSERHRERIRWRYKNDKAFKEKMSEKNKSPTARARKERWRKKNGGWVSEWFSRRRAKQRGTYKPLTKAEKRIVKDWYRFRDILNRVHGKTMFHVDHIVPLSRGGAHSPSNLQVTTGTYNVRKFTNPDPIRGHA